MEIIRQFGIIIGVSFLGEGLRALLPFPIPASVYGLLLMLAALCTGLLKVERVRACAMYLIQIMPMMFIPAVAGVAEEWAALQPVLVPFLLCSILSTMLVMGVTGRTAQGVISLEKRDGHE